MASDPANETRLKPAIPASILIVGSGVFGLSTAWALCNNPLFEETAITVVDRQPFPTPDGSSIDTSRIIRPDYASPPYTRLATRAQQAWRTTFAPSHYHEPGLCLTAASTAQNYVRDALANVRAQAADRIDVLDSAADIHRVCGLPPGIGDEGSGATGYVNWSSGWADAEGAMKWLRAKVEATDRVRFVVGRVQRLAFSPPSSSPKDASPAVTGVELADGSNLTASLTLLATGAWSSALLDLRGIVKATGQPICYKPISSAEEAALRNNPTLLNLSTGLFMIPPRGKLLKIARHGHGYTNPTTIPHPELNDDDDDDDKNESITVSLPYTQVDNPAQQVPREGQRACTRFLAAIHPQLAAPSRPWTRSKICWYADTRNGDFLIDYHPQYRGLFVATGGSGHGFKFLPVIGECIVDCVLGRTPEDFKGKWDWPAERLPEEQWPGDGSRGGPVGLTLRGEASKVAGKL